MYYFLVYPDTIRAFYQFKWAYNCFFILKSEWSVIPIKAAVLLIPVQLCHKQANVMAVSTQKKQCKAEIYRVIFQQSGNYILVISNSK